MAALLTSDICSLFSDAGAVAQLGERLICIQEVVGSTPIGSIPGARNREPGSKAPKRLRRGRDWLSDLGGGKRGPIILAPGSCLLFLDNVKRVLAAGEAPVVSLRGRRRGGACRMLYGSSMPKAVIGIGSRPGSRFLVAVPGIADRVCSYE